MKGYREDVRFSGLLYPRAYRALVLIGLALLLAVAGGWLFGLAGGSHSSNWREELSGISALPGIGLLEFGENGVYMNAEKLAAGFSGELPPSFREEVLDIEGDAMCSSDDGGVVVGFVRAEDAVQLMEAAKARLSDRGWREVPSGHDSLTTFVKNEGEFRWATLSCSAVNGPAALVVNARKGDASAG